VTLRRAGGTTIGTVGSNVTAQLVTALSLTGLTAGSAIYVADASGNQVDYVASSGTSYTLNTTGGTGTWSWKVARYGFLAATGTHSPATASTSVTVSLATDPFVTEADSAVVAAYSALTSPDRIYDRAAYEEANSAAGMALPRIASKAAALVSLGSYPLILNASGAAWSMSSGTLTLNISTAFVAGVTMTGGLTTIGAVTLNAQATAAGTWASISGGSIALAGGVNYQPLVAATSITGLPTSGQISGGGSIAFGSGTTYAPTGSFSAANTAFSGTLTVSTSTARTFTATSVTGSQFTVTTSGAGSVKVLREGSTTTSAFTIGTSVTIRHNVAITAPGGIPLSTYVVKNSTTVLGWQALTAERTLEIADADTFSIYVTAYGYRPQLISASGSNDSTFSVSLVPETYVDTTLSTTTRDVIAAKFASSVDALSRLVISIASDLRSYSPAEVLNGMHYFTVTQGAIIAASALTAGSTSGFALIDGGMVVGSPGFYAKVSDSVTTTNDLGILVPIFIDVLPAVYTADPTYTPVRKNTSGLILQTAPWTKMTADISSLDKTDIRRGLATEDNVTAVRAKTDANLDVAVSSRLSAAAYTAPTTAPTSAQNAAAVRTDLATELGRIDVATSTRLASASYTAPTSAPTSAQVASAVRVELAAELARLDVATSTRLATTAYAPTSAPTSTEVAAAVRVELAAELARIDAAVTSRLAAANYTAPGTAPTSAQNAAAVRSELATELARIDAAVSSRLAASAYTAAGAAPTSAEVAAAVRTEIAVELARLDVATSTRLADADFVEPDNAGINAIKANAALIPALV
jgi:hypothetical protein